VFRQDLWLRIKKTYKILIFSDREGKKPRLLCLKNFFLLKQKIGKLVLHFLRIEEAQSQALIFGRSVRTKVFVVRRGTYSGK